MVHSIVATSGYLAPITPGEEAYQANFKGLTFEDLSEAELDVHRRKAVNVLKTLSPEDYHDFCAHGYGWQFGLPLHVEVSDKLSTILETEHDQKIVAAKRERNHLAKLRGSLGGLAAIAGITLGMHYSGDSDSACITAYSAGICGLYSLCLTGKDSLKRFFEIEKKEFEFHHLTKHRLIDEEFERQISQFIKKYSSL